MPRVWPKNMVFLDANVILELILKDCPYFEQVKTFLESINDSTAISALGIHLIMYFGRKEKIGDALLESVIDENELLSSTSEDYIWAALNEQGRDFEDALQPATAIRYGCQKFVTLGSSLAKMYAEFPIEIIVP